MAIPATALFALGVDCFPGGFIVGVVTGAAVDILHWILRLNGRC